MGFQMCRLIKDIGKVVWYALTGLNGASILKITDSPRLTQIRGGIARDVLSLSQGLFLIAFTTQLSLGSLK